MFAADLPPIDQVRITCSVQAAQKQGIPAEVMIALAKMEGGKPNLRMKNTNGTEDLGYMQFNTAYIASIKHMGVEEQHVLADGCFSFHLAAWRVKQHLVNDKGGYFKRVANYHSRTEKYNARYRKKLIEFTQKWRTWLANNNVGQPSKMFIRAGAASQKASRTRRAIYASPASS